MAPLGPIVQRYNKSMLGLHVLCYVFRVPPPSLHRDLAIQSVSLKVVTWSDFWPAAGEKFGILDHPTLLKCVVFVVQTVEYEPKMLKNFRLTAAELLLLTIRLLSKEVKGDTS